MPLLGTLSTNTIHQLLEATSESASDAVIHVRTPSQHGVITIKQGQVVQVQQMHQELDTALDQLLSSDQGHFLLCQAGEPPPSTQEKPAPILWLLDTNEARKQEILTQLQSLNISAQVLVAAEEMADLLNQEKPHLFLLEDQLAYTHQQELLPHLGPSQSTATKLMLLGQPDPIPEAFQQVGAERMAWPMSEPELEPLLLRWLPPSTPPDGNPVLSLLASFAPFTPELRVKLHPSRVRELKGLNIAPAWERWLVQLDRNVPLQTFLQHCPGSKEEARVLVYGLLQLGVLTTQDVTSELDEIMEGAEEAPPPLQLHKIIAIGLRGQWKQDWVNSLKKISQNQSARIPREHPFPVPYLPKLEHARIPLRADTLLVVYGARNEEIIDQIIEQTNPHITGFLYFAEYENADEMEHIRFMRQSIEARFQSRHLYMIASKNDTSQDELRHALHSPNDSLIVSLKQFDLHSTHTALQTLLQSFTRQRR